MPQALPRASVPPASSGERAAAHIRRLIFDGELRPGDRVPQDQIAAELGMSKIPVREALVALEREGWVTLELNRGVFVNVLDEQVVRDQFELFGLLYGFAAERAIGHRDPALIPELTRIQMLLDATDDPVEVDRLVYAFHSTVVDAAHSPRLKAVLRGMSALVPGSFFSIVGAAADVERRGIYSLLRAMKRGYPAAAATSYQKMMYEIGDVVVTVFRDRGLFDQSTSALASGDTV
jgi:DNA-binding GntR family transcriptional regulator